MQRVDIWMPTYLKGEIQKICKKKNQNISQAVRIIICNAVTRGEILTDETLNMKLREDLI